MSDFDWHLFFLCAAFYVAGIHAAIYWRKR